MKHKILILSTILLSAGSINAIIDTNTNGLSDLWEKAHNSGELFPGTFDPHVDADTDGWTNAQEAAAGTDPFTINSPEGMIRPEIIRTPAVIGEENGVPILISPAVVSVSWPTIPGKQYTLLASLELGADGWMTIDEPFLGSGGTPEFHFESSETSAGEKCFWRIAVTDVDSDGDTLTNAEEHQLGTNPFLKDSDADGMDDNVDPQPISGIPSFPDADGDGIADEDDPDPSIAAGDPPSLNSETATTSRIVDVVAAEDLVFLLHVANPDGPPVTASDLKLFVSGTEESATFTSLGDNRFSLTWTTRVHNNYPEKILQSLMVRFRDSRMATAWIELARLDVAQWQGMVAGLTVSYKNIHTRTFSIGGHSGGIRLEPSPWSGTYGLGPSWYRGPRVIRFYGRNTEETPPGADMGTLSIGEGMRYPFFIIDDTDSPLAPQNTVRDISDPGLYPHGYWGLNQWSGAIQMAGAGATSTIEPATANHFPVPQPLEQDAPYSFEAKFFQDEQWKPALNNIWSVVARTSSRSMHALTATASTTPGAPTILDWSCFVPVEVRISASAAGPLEYPGLPLDSMRESPPLFMAPKQWHRIVVKVGPDAAVVARGVRLRLNPGPTGEDPPQAGIDFKRKTATGFEDFTLGEILEGTDLYNELTGPDGMVLFARFGLAVDRLHRLNLDLLPNGTTLAPLEVKSFGLVPVDVDDNEFASGVDDVSITADPTDIGYQKQFWLMAPTGNAPNGERCSNDTLIKIPLEPANHMRMDCTLAQCEYRDPVDSTAASPAVPIGPGAGAPVRWLGTGTESGDYTPIYKLGATQQQIDLPVSVKVMKRRTVKVVVHYVTGRTTLSSGNIQLRPPTSQPNSSLIKNKLFDVFTRQINTWFVDLECVAHEVAWDIGEDSDWGTNLSPVTGTAISPFNRELNLGGPVETESPVSIEEQELLNVRGANADIDVFVIGGCCDIQTYVGINGLASRLGNFPRSGVAKRERSAVYLAGELPIFDNPVQEDLLLQAIAHEIGHIFIGNGHPDDDSDNGVHAGVAPLTGTNRLERLMFSDGTVKKSAAMLGRNLLVKKEWDEAEKWLKANPDVRIRLQNNLGADTPTGNY